nr:MAG TPA: Major head protein [Bacteriophage sp.]
MEKKELLKMNLQHFAEPAAELPKDEPKPPAAEPPKDEPKDEPENGDPQPNLEEQLQQMRIENAKLKKAQEDAATDASNWKKKYNATLSDAEKLAQEKADKEAEKDAELNRLRRESAVSKFEKNFLTLGYSQELAKKAAEAQFDGDTDTLFLVQSQAQEAILKAKESEWFKNRPEVNTGVGSGGDDPFLQGFNS